MTFDIKFFLAAIGLLCLPLPYALSRVKAGEGYRVRTPQAPTVGGMWRAWQNWLDLFRAAAGTYLLMEKCIHVASPTPETAAQALAIKAVVFGVGLLVQTIRFGGGIKLFAPLFYLTGVTACLSGYTEGEFALLVGWAFALGMQDTRLQLPAMGIALGVAGYFLDGLREFLLLNCALIFAPLLLAVLSGRRLVFVSLVRDSAQHHHWADGPGPAVSDLEHRTG